MKTEQEKQFERINIYIGFKLALLAFTLIMVGVEYYFHIMTYETFTFSSLVMLFSLANSLALRFSIVKRHPSFLLLTHISIYLDNFLIILSLYFNGGVENSWLFFPVFPIFLAAFLFGTTGALAQAAFAFVTILTFFFLEFARLIPHFSVLKVPEAYWRLPVRYANYALGLFILYFVVAGTTGFYVRSIRESADKLEEANDKINQKMAELERMNKFMVGRETDMISLKKEVNALLKSQGRPEKY